MKRNNERKKENKLPKIIRIVFRVSALLIPAILIFLICTKIAGIKYLCVLSPSMEPELPVGSLIAVVPTDPEKIREGDNLTYLSGGNYITHKVVANDTVNKTVTTRGVAGKLEDAPVPYGAAVGIQKICIPGLGRFAAILSTSNGKIILLSAATAVFLAIMIADIVIRKRREAAAIKSDLSV